MIEKCPISGYQIESKPEWFYSSSIDKEYSVAVSFIDNNIVHLNVKGYTTDGNKLEVWPLVAKLIKTKLNDKPYYLIHNYKDFKGGDSGARNYYIQWISEHIKSIKGVYFYNTSPYLKIIINAGKLFSSKLRKTYLHNTYEQTINDIISNELGKSKLSPKDNWSINKTFNTEKNNSFTIQQTWTFTLENREAKIETYLLNSNIFIRRYFGILSDNSMPEIEESFENILEQTNLLNSEYHFYIDFENVERMTLGHRKDGLNWFINHRRSLISSGFFNISAMMQIQVKIARSLAPFASLRKRVHIVNNLSEVFTIIENPNANKQDNLIQTNDFYKESTKEELISEIRMLSDRVLFIENERETQIREIYHKLGRVTWDETYEFTENEIDNSSNPFADINNAVVLIQKDIKEILGKRDNLILKAQESDRLKSLFLANMSHEIRTPMNSIIGFTSLLLEDIKDEKHHKYLSLVNNSSQHLLSLINDILDISKIQSGDFKLHYSTFDIDELIHSIIAEQELTRPNPRVKIVFNSSNSLIVNYDKTRIKQVFINLLSNALKFTEKGEIIISYSLQDDTIEFSIKDTGRGIKEDTQRFIFERFRQVDDAITKQFEGAGLGLAITKSLIELHNGKIWLESEFGKGSTFFFNLPYRDKLKKNDRIIRNTTTSCSTKNMTFLIAEDNIENFIYLEAILNAKDNRILHAKTGNEVLEIFQKEKIDLILIDIQMPEMDGLTCTKELRKIDTNIPIIAQTALAMEEDKNRSLAAGCNDYIDKPIKKELLFSMIHKLLG